jgi:hypothetical protein
MYHSRVELVVLGIHKNWRVGIKERYGRSLVVNMEIQKSKGEMGVFGLGWALRCMEGCADLLFGGQRLHLR